MFVCVNCVILEVGRIENVETLLHNVYERAFNRRFGTQCVCYLVNNLIFSSWWGFDIIYGSLSWVCYSPMIFGDDILNLFEGRRRVAPLRLGAAVAATVASPATACSRSSNSSRSSSSISRVCAICVWEAEHFILWHMARLWHLFETYFIYIFLSKF